MVIQECDELRWLLQIRALKHWVKVFVSVLSIFHLFSDCLFFLLRMLLWHSSFTYKEKRTLKSLTAGIVSKYTNESCCENHRVFV